MNMAFEEDRTSEERILETEEGILTTEEFQKHIWDIFTAYCEVYGPATQMLESYNAFLNETLPNIVEECGNCTYYEAGDGVNPTLVHEMRARNPKMEKELYIKITERGTKRTLFPDEARKRNLDYTKPLLADFEYTVYREDSCGSREMISSVSGESKLGDIPIMVKSIHCSLYGLNDKELCEVNEDPADAGGYFIINGKERILLGQERAATNQLFVFKPWNDAKYKLEAEIRSLANPDSENSSALWIRVPGRPVSERRTLFEQNEVDHSVSNGPEKMMKKASGMKGGLREFLVTHPGYIKKISEESSPGFVVHHMSIEDGETVPLVVLYKALGFLNDKFIWNTFQLPDNDNQWTRILMSTMSCLKAADVETVDEALIFLGKRQKKRKADGTARLSDQQFRVKGLAFINNEVLPHIGNGSSGDDNQLKAFYLGHMVNRLMKVMTGKIPCNDRDHLENKRYDLAGPLLAQLLKRFVARMFIDMRERLKKRVENKRSNPNKPATSDFFKQIVGPEELSMKKSFHYALATGNWGDKRRNSDREIRSGVSQVLNRITGLASLSFLRKINSPVNRLVRMTAPRNVHNTAFGYICPSDTPEGVPVGLLKNLAIMAHISVQSPVVPLYKFFHKLELGNLPIDPANFNNRYTKIFIDGDFFAIYPNERANNATCVVDMFKKWRSAWNESKFKADTELYWMNKSAQTKEELQRGLAAGTLTNATTDAYITQNCTQEMDTQSETSSIEDTDNCCGIPHQMSICYDRTQFGSEIRIRTDGGRPMRPLFVVENNYLKLKKHHLEQLLDKDNPYSWDGLVKDGIIEFLDAAEEETAMIAMFPSDLRVDKKKLQHGEYPTTYTHCEIHPAAILGVCGSLIPFVNHNQSPRNTYQCNMAKQSIGIYSANHKHRFDTEMHVLHYPQRPLVTTKPSLFTKADEYPAGINAVVAIMSYTGYNQEDSVIINSSATERGLFRSSHFKSYSSSAKVAGGRGDQDQAFEIPSTDEVRQRRANYNNLDADGLPSVGDEIKDHQAVIGKTERIPAHQQNQFSTNPAVKLDMSEIYKVSCASSDSYIDSVMLTNDGDGYEMAKVRVRNPRSPKLGDKFASRHGQKGVVGMMYHETDLPFSKSGMVPDIIINPHAIPSRMTIGHLKETHVAKACALMGTIGDGTPFSHDLSYEDEDVQKILKEKGFHNSSLETVYCGLTGRKIGTQVFLGPCFYQRLKHMTEDKLHFRARGPITQLCRQPVSGLHRDGGLRFGEMERDAVITHGSANFLRERLLLVSDPYTVKVCSECGNMLIRILDRRPTKSGIPRKALLLCKSCQNNQTCASTVELPYACKLLLQELNCMNISVKLLTETELPERKERSSTNCKKDYGANILQHLITLADQQSLETWMDYKTPFVCPTTDYDHDTQN